MRNMMLAKRKSFIEKKSKKEKETHDTDFGNSEGRQGEDPGSSENEYCKKKRKKKMQTEHFRKLSCVGTNKERTTNRPKNIIQKCRSVGRRKGNSTDPIKCVS